MIDLNTSLYLPAQEDILCSVTRLTAIEAYFYSWGHFLFPFSAEDLIVYRVTQKLAFELHQIGEKVIQGTENLWFDTDGLGRENPILNLINENRALS